MDLALSERARRRAWEYNRRMVARGATAADRIAELVAEHGSVPPPWAAFPRVHPMDIGWRMGAGEDHIGLLHQWAR